MATLKVEIDPQSLKCSICLATVSDPRILPCGHTFCGLKSPDKCLQMLDPRNAGKIKCPNCKKEHQVRVADVPPDIKCKEMLESLGSKKQRKRMCHKHGEKIAMRCKIDGELVCLSCIAGDHSGHQLEKVHKEEHKRLSDFWTKEKAKLEDKQLESRVRQESFQREAENLEKKRLQEYSLDNKLGVLITRRDEITRKLSCDDFNPDDEDVTVLREYMEQLEATSECQQEASKDVRERSQQLIKPVASRAPAPKFLQHINTNPVPATTRTTPILPMFPGPSKRPTGVAQMPTLSQGGSTSRREVGRRTLPEENASCTTNILALGEKGRHYILGLKDSRWEQWKGRTTDFYFGFGAICYKEKVYLIGGYRGDCSPKVAIFHIRESKWTEGPELNITRATAATCFVESQRSIYVCGGGKSDLFKDNINLVEKLELDENGSPFGVWRKVTPMQEKRTGCAAVAVGSRLFVTGGVNEHSKRLSSVEIYDIEAEDWNYGPQMKQARYNHAVGHYDRCIYAMGGCYGGNIIKLCEKLDLQSWTWITIESFCVPHSDFGSVVANGKIYVVGGYTKGGDVPIVEIFDPVLNTWSRGPQLPDPLYRTKCVCW